MSKVDDLSGIQPTAPRRLAGARRLLIATIGAATVNYAGCGDDTMTLVANLMAAPYMPPQGDGGDGRAAPPTASNPKGLAGNPAHPGDANDQDGGVNESDLGAHP